MNKHCTISFLSGLMLILIFCSGDLYSQQIDDPEAEYMRVRTMAFDGNYSEAAAAARSWLTRIQHTVMQEFSLEGFLPGRRITVRLQP